MVYDVNNWTLLKHLNWCIIKFFNDLITLNDKTRPPSLCTGHFASFMHSCRRFGSCILWLILLLTLYFLYWCSTALLLHERIYKGLASQHKLAMESWISTKSFVGTKYQNKQQDIKTHPTLKHLLSYISPQIIATNSEVTCCIITDSLKNFSWTVILFQHRHYN